MRTTMFSAGILLVASLAAGQATVTPSWFATNRYSWEPTAPLVNTPTLQLNTPQMEVGASNATADNAAGATAAAPLDLGVTASGSTLPYTWTTPMLIAAPQTAPSRGVDVAARSAGLDLGAAEFDSAYDFPNLGQQSIAQIAAETRKRAEQHAAKAYTNDDISRLKNQENPAPRPASPPGANQQPSPDSSQPH
jgi:hypothetical protein